MIAISCWPAWVPSTKFGRSLMRFNSLNLIKICATILVALSFVLALPVAAADAEAGYKLGPGDKLRITTFNEPDLTGEFEVSSVGMVAMPLIGEVKASGKTVGQLKGAITSALADGYLKDPRISIDVVNYRPFFIVGEVMKPGSYSYVTGMSVINAVALAGGYTYRADKDEIFLKRGGQSAPEEKVKEDAPVNAGDVIRVPERFF